jgi:hypothetical protein
MNIKIQTTAIALAAGIILMIIIFSAQYVYFRDLDLFISSMVNGGPVIWFMLIVPLFFSSMGLLLGILRGRLVLAGRELEAMAGRMDSTEQQSEIKLFMEEISANLDHLVDINNNIHEGICVIDRNYIIEFGYNRSFLEIFGNSEYIGKDVFTSIFASLPGDTLKEVKEFMDLCFLSTSASDDILNNVNPLNKFRIFNFDGTEEKEKILKSKIVRIKNMAGDIANIMFIFSDVTIDEKLDIAFEKQEKDFQDELSIMSMIYKNDRDIELDKKNTDVLYAIQGTIHLVKGEAFALGFDDIALAAGDLESYIKKTANQVIRFDESFAMLELGEKLNAKIENVFQISRKLFAIGEGVRKFSSGDISANRINFVTEVSL